MRVSNACALTDMKVMASAWQMRVKDKPQTRASDRTVRPMNNHGSIVNFNPCAF